MRSLIMIVVAAFIATIGQSALADEAAVKAAVNSMIKAIGEDPSREGLVGTPQRVAEMYAELFGGLNEIGRAHV